MAHGFVTELLAEKPQVVVITTSLPLVGVLAPWSKEVSLEYIVPSQLPKRVNEFLTAYRVVWIASKINELPTPEEISLLRTFNERLVVVCPLFTGTQDTRPLLAHWATQSQEVVDVLTQVIAQLPQANWLLGLDVFSDIQTSPVLQTLTCLLSKNVWLDPQLDFYPQTWSAFLQNLPLCASQPGRFSKIIRGRKVHTTTMVKLLRLQHQRFTGLATEVESLEVLPTTLVEWPSSTSIKIEPLEELCQAIVSTLKSPLVRAQTQVQTRVRASTQPIISEAVTLRPAPTPSVRKVVIVPPKTVVRPPQTHLAQGLAAKVNRTTPTQPAVLTTSLPRAPEVKLEEKLTALFQEYRSEQKVEQVKGVAHETTQTKKKSLRKKKFFWIGLVLIGIFVTLGLGVGLLSITTQQLKEALLTQTSESITEKPISLSRGFTFWYRLARIHHQALSFLPGTQVVESGQLVQATDALLRFQASSRLAQHTSVNLVLAATGRFPAEVTQLLTKLQSQHQEAYTRLTEAQLYFKQAAQYQGESDKKQFQALETQLQNHKRSFVPFQQLQPLLPSLLGLEGKKTYAVLLQNHQELRPMGGITQAIAFITLDGGQVVDTQVVSASSIVPATTSPSVPPDMARLLGITELRLSDSNWSPDAPTSADQTIAFLEQATTKNIDGVVFVNTLHLAEWLRVVGPLELPEYQETITAQNFLERLEAHSERQLVGNVQSDYAATLLLKLVQKTLIISPEKIPDLLKVFADFFESKQMALVVKEPAASGVLRELGWSGSLIEPACPPALQQDRCLVDVIAQAESNIGSNKANIYLDRQVSHQVSLLPDGIQHAHKIVYTNRSTSNAWPRGSYNAYIRLYVSPTARLEGITANGQNLASEQLVSAFENNRQVFGAVIEVPIQQAVTLEYRYFQPAEQLPPFSYALFTQFQPGIEVPEYQVSLDTGPFQPSLVAPQATITGSRVVFRSPTSLQSLVGVRF